ncbi:MAG: insulinase family protein [Holosporales bacterium]|nr:insulinase family protein [Holosporales bacterium]
MNIKKTELRNGLVVATDRIDNFETASIGIFVNIGSVNENSEQIGVSHFLEHMAFKGTTNRTALQISKAIESVGGIINAYTSKEVTAYHTKVLKGDIKLAIDIITDILQNSIFDTEEFEKERGVIIQEIRQVNDTPDDLVFDMFQEKCFDGEHLGTSILGSENDIRSYRPEALKNYLDTKYSTKKMILAASGKVDHDEISNIADELTTSMRPFDIEVVEKQVYKGGFIYKKKDLEQSHLVFGFEGISTVDDDKYALRLMSTILGCGMSSRLFQEIRERRGLAYSVFSFVSNYRDTGTFGIYSACEHNKAREVLKIAKDEVLKIGNDLSEEELQKAKTQMKASILMGLESSSNRMERMANQLLLQNLFLTPGEAAKKVDSVMTEDIKRISKKIASSKITLAVVGNGSDIEELYAT